MGPKLIALLLACATSAPAWAARSISLCHLYLSAYERPFTPAYQGKFHRVHFSWPLFQLHLKELMLKYPDRFELTSIGRDAGYDMYRVTTLGDHRDRDKIRLVITGGVHGEEPLGVAAALDLIERYATDESFRRKVEFVMYPALGPWGLTRFSRINEQRKNYYGGWRPNSGYRGPELVMKDLEGEHFDLALDLHGAWPFTKHYLIRRHPDGGISDRAIAAVPPEERLGTRSGEFPARNTPTGSYWMVAPGISQAQYGYGTIQHYLDSIADLSFTTEYPGVPHPDQAHEHNMNLILALIDEVHGVVR